MKTPNNNQIAIIGGGIAGCASARLLAERGFKVTIFEREASLAQGGSGNPAAILYPRLSGNNLGSHFANTAFNFSTAFYQSLGLAASSFQQCGLLQLAYNETIHSRLKQAAKHFPNTGKMLDQATASKQAGIDCPFPALAIQRAAWLTPQHVCAAMVKHANIQRMTNTEITEIKRNHDGAQLILPKQQAQTFQQVILCNADAALGFSQTAHLPLSTVKGQVSLINASPSSRQLRKIICTNGYLSPAIDDQHHLGATFEPNVKDLAMSSNAHHENRKKFQSLASDLLDTNMSAWQASVRTRCVTPDKLPLVGNMLDQQLLGSPLPRAGLKRNTLAWHPNLWVNLAHGSHGFIYAPYCAKLLADLICNDINKADKDLLSYLNPNRFLLREYGLKRLARTVAAASMTDLHFAPDQIFT